MSVQAERPGRGDGPLAAAIERLDVDALRRDYLDMDEFLFLERFVPDELLAECLRELEQLKPHVHRNFIPRHKKGGSVGFDTIEAYAPTIAALYRSPALLAFLGDLVGSRIEYCPDEDLHRCALYCYTEPGDHIGFHYDTSYYRGSRYTVLVGLHDESSSRLVCRLRTRDPRRSVVEKAIRTGPGSLAVFDGDKVLHAVTPVAAGECRFMVTMQFVTDPTMRPFQRFVSDMKDAIAYFGFRKVFGTRARLEAS